MTKLIFLSKLDALRSAVERLPDYIIVSYGCVDEVSVTREPRVYVRLESGVRELAAACGASVDVAPLSSVMVSFVDSGVEIGQFENIGGDRRLDATGRVG